MYNIEYRESKTRRERYQASGGEQPRPSRRPVQAAVAGFGPWLDELTAGAELDDFLGQLLVAISRRVGASAASLRVRPFEQNGSPLELVFQAGRLRAPKEATSPENGCTRSADEPRFSLFLDRPIAISSSSPGPQSPLPEEARSSLLGLGGKAVWIIPLVFGDQANGQLTFHFDRERALSPEDFSLAQALGAQTSLAIHLIGLARAARQAAVLEERNRLAGEIHDSLAQHFAGIAMQLAVAAEDMAAGKRSALGRVRLAGELAEVGVAEARRSALSLRPKVLEESGLVGALRLLAERCNLPGRLRCEWRADHLPEQHLSPGQQHELLRIAQEAMSNAVRHAKPTRITVALRWERPHLRLEIRDDGAGMAAKAPLQENKGLGLGNLRARVSKLGGQLAIQTAPGRGTRLVVTVPIAS